MEGPASSSPNGKKNEEVKKKSEMAEKIVHEDSGEESDREGITCHQVATTKKMF